MVQMMNITSTCSFNPITMMHGGKAVSKKRTLEFCSKWEILYPIGLVFLIPILTLLLPRVVWSWNKFHAPTQLKLQEMLRSSQMPSTIAHSSDL